MNEFMALWMPTLLSAVVVFLASSVIHMMTPFHKNDYATPPNQDGLADAIRPFNLKPGDYLIPRPDSMKELGTPEFKAKAERGPRIVFTVLPNGMTSMGPLLAKWFVYVLLISASAGFITCTVLPHGAPYLHVFHHVALVAFLGYAAALWQANIWFGKGLGLTIRATFDGAIYALLTAGVFGWLWPR